MFATTRTLWFSTWNYWLYKMLMRKLLRAGDFFFYSYLPSHLRYIQSHQILIDLACFGSHWSIVGHFLRTLIVFDVVCNVCVTLMAMRHDPDASCHFLYQHDVEVRTDSHIHVNLLNVTLDNESNVQVSRSPHNEAKTKAVKFKFFCLNQKIH